MGFEETGYIEVEEGYCDYRGCGNGYYLTACGELLKYEPVTNGECTACGKPIQGQKDWRPEE